MNKETKECNWKCISTDYTQVDKWKTRCGEIYALDKGDTPETAGMKFCPICGKKISTPEE